MAAARVPINRRVDKKELVLKYIEYYSAIKKNGISTAWMNLERIMLSEINQTEKDNYL